MDWKSFAGIPWQTARMCSIQAKCTQQQIIYAMFEMPKMLLGCWSPNVILPKWRLSGHPEETRFCKLMSLSHSWDSEETCFCKLLSQFHSSGWQIWASSIFTRWLCMSERKRIENIANRVVQWDASCSGTSDPASMNTVDAEEPPVLYLCFMEVVQ